MLFLFGAILALLSIFSLCYSLREWWQARLIRNTPTTRVAEIKDAGFYRTKGKVVCNESKVLPNWKTPCVYYLAVLEELVSDDYQSADGSANDRGRYRVAASRSEQCSFFIEDEDGSSISVNPEGAAIFSTELQSDGQGGENLASALFERDAKGMKIFVKAIKTGAEVNVIGQVSGEGDRVSFSDNGFYLISTRDPNEIGREKKLLAGVGLFFALFSLTLSAICMAPLLR